MNPSSCACKPDIPLHLLKLSDLLPTDQESLILKQYVSNLKFEPTAVGTKTKKAFRIKNDTLETQTYSIQRDPNSNPIYHVFDFKVMSSTVSKNNYLECIVTYSPQVPNERTVDCIQIIDKDFRVYKIILEGECIGPVVNASIKCLYFYRTKNDELIKNTFELRNTSNVKSVFQFDVNEEQSELRTFKISKLRGTLLPHAHTYITVQFPSTEIGIYSRFLYCKIMYHPPITIELVAAQTRFLEFDLSDICLRRYPQAKEQLEGYNYYMHDSVKTTNQEPPFSLSINYLDFGGVKYEKDKSNCSTLVTCLTNHISTPIEVLWHNNTNGIFEIFPEDIQIPPGQSALYECRFRPDQSDQMYSNILTACIYWTNLRRTIKEVAYLEVIDVPLNISLRVLGHSFPENKVWLPRVEIIPNVVVLPPTMPMSPSYTTFMLQASGHLPTSFKFVPPKKSNFTLKPMIGIIDDYQIIVAQLQPDLNDKKAYIELWGVELNSRTKDSIPFYLKGYSEYATITVGTNNTITFKPVHPGCQDVSTVVIKNPTTHFLKYNFILPEDSYISINHSSGQLIPNEIDYLKWYITGSVCAAEVSIIRCEVQTLQGIKVLTGVPLDTFVTIYSKCSPSQLCCTPNYYDFGEIQWGAAPSTKFHLFNFCEAPIHFKLIPKNIEVADLLMIVPTQGTVTSRQNFEVVVNIKALITGLHKIKIMYQLRLNEMSDLIVDDGNSYDIFDLEIRCSYPTLQIIDISANNFGFLFSKYLLWEMFNIKEINKVLQEIEHDQTKSVEIYLPECEMGDNEFFANLIVQNVSQFATEINIKREKLCDCKLVIQSKSFSIRTAAYDCIHKDVFKMSLSNESFQENSTETLKMEVKYQIRDFTRMSYIISLSNNRTIKLYANVCTLSEIVTMASKYSRSYQLNFGDVFIGEKQYPAKAFQLYNNSSFVIQYKIDTLPLSILNFDYGFDVFKCLNLSGTILPFSVKYILFTFSPITTEFYKVCMPFKMGENEFLFELLGNGVVSYTPNVDDVLSTMPFVSKGLYIENAVELSTEYLTTNPIPTWSTHEEMIFIKNLTSDRVIGYSWQTCTIERIVNVKTVHKKGVLQPKESHAVIIVINSFDQPCHLRIQMTCKLLDHTQHILRAKSLLAYEEKHEELQDQFTITEKGIFYPKNDIVILPAIKNFYTSLTISLCISSTFDRDVHMNVIEQLQQSPQYGLHVNTENIVQRYSGKLYSKQLSAEEKRLASTRESKRKEINGQLLKTTVECLLADALFSELFYRIVVNSNRNPSPLYIQFKIDDNESRSITKDDIKRSMAQNMAKRMKLTENFLNRPQAPIVTSVFKELITDSIHEVFQLGPQIKHRSDEHNIYWCVTKDKFICSCKM